MTGTTLNTMFQESARKWATKAALRQKADGQYRDISYGELAGRVEQMASGLTALGVRKGDRVALLSENRPEWVVTDLAVQALGAVNVPLYTTLPAPQIAFILQNSGATVLVVSDSKQLQKALKARADAPALKHIVVMDAEPPLNDTMVTPYASVGERGAQTPLGPAYAPMWQAAQPDDVASIVYTSGTTGDPKGAMLTHHNFVSNADAAAEHYRNAGDAVTDADTFLSFLPLSHVYERTTGYYLPLRVGATIAYAESLFAVQNNMAEVRPTLMVAVPRLYESMQERILDAAAKAPPKRRRLFEAALQAGREAADRRRERRWVGPVLGFKHVVFDRLVFAKLRERFGGRFRFFVAGGAALSDETARFFDAIGLPVMQGYGMTETAPVIAAMPNDRPKLGSVGIALPGVHIKIAPDGEILVQGPNVMKGYWANEAGTGDVIDNDGWLHTGDIGVLDAHGFLTITDRKKDILVLANGKNVAPQPIESALKGSPFLNEVVLIGDKQNVVTALVVPNFERLRAWAKEAGLTFDDNDALITQSETKKRIKQEIDAHSGALADYEKVRKFTLLATAFSVDGGELTPTLKIKRKVVAQKYAQQIAEMRGESVAA